MAFIKTIFPISFDFHKTNSDFIELQVLKMVRNYSIQKEFSPSEEFPIFDDKDDNDVHSSQQNFSSSC